MPILKNGVYMKKEQGKIYAKILSDANMTQDWLGEWLEPAKKQGMVSRILLGKSATTQENISRIDKICKRLKKITESEKKQMSKIGA